MKSFAGLRFTESLYTPQEAELLEGLFKFPKELPYKYLYDEKGSALFEQICELEEYYPTRLETAILRENRQEISERLGPECLLIELGSGSSLKTRLILDVLQKPAGYIPIDISGEYLFRTAEKLYARYPSLEIRPLCADYCADLQIPLTRRAPKRKVFFFPGSTIGNFHPAEAVDFLSRINGLCESGDMLLIGFDRIKNKAVLEAAYNDSKGITAKFNRNLLDHISRLFHTDMHSENFEHFAFYRDSPFDRIEMRLISKQDQLFKLAGEFIPVRRGESILTECSYKYTEEGFGYLAKHSGYRYDKIWTDADEWFCVALMVKP